MCTVWIKFCSSSDWCTLCIPHVKMKTDRHCSFFCGLFFLSGIPCLVKLDTFSQLLHAFKTNLKTNLSKPTTAASLRLSTPKLFFNHVTWLMCLSVCVWGWAGDVSVHMCRLCLQWVCTVSTSTVCVCPFSFLWFELLVVIAIFHLRCLNVNVVYQYLNFVQCAKL